MEQWQIILFVAFIALLRWIFRGGGLKDILGGGDEAQPPSRGRVQKEESEDERVRKFMEALGVPPTQAPPRRVIPPAAQKRRDFQRRAASKPAYVPKTVLPLPELPKPIEPPVAPEPAPMTPHLKTVESAYQSETEFKPVVEAPAGIKGLDVRSLLKSPDSVRTAVILRELLGPPRSLQSFSSTPNVL